MQHAYAGDHPIRVVRKGFNVSISDGNRTLVAKAESAPEARRFASQITWLAGVHPEWSLDELVAHAGIEHRNAFFAQAKRRRGSCFACGHYRAA